MEENKKVTVYTWKYDNGARGYAVKQEDKKGWLEQDVYTTRKAVIKRYKEYKKQFDCQPGREATPVRKKKIDILGGLYCVKQNYPYEQKDYQERNGLDAMLALLNSCGETPDAKREMLRLVASVLAGYCAHVSSKKYMQYLSQLQRRAPIIIVKPAPFAGEVLERVIRSLALDTTDNTLFGYIRSGPTMKCKYTPVLPRKASDIKITDRAFLKLQGYNERMLPQYRDTTLMVYGWFLRGNDSKILQLMNKWVSIVIYGASNKRASNKSVVITPVEIKGKDLAKSDCQWDLDDVRFSVVRYARYVYKADQKNQWETMLQSEFSRYDAMIDSHNQNSNTKINTVERYHVSLQLLALHLFLKSCVRGQDLDQSKANKLENEWFTVLLPGCEIISTSDFAVQEEIEAENRVKEKFESTLFKILKEGFPDKFYISEKNYKVGMWGDIWLRPQKNPPSGIYYIRFSTEHFKTLLNNFGGVNGGTWLYEEVKKLDLDYIEYSKKMRVNATDTNEKGVFFQIDKMTFLPQELRAKLNDAGQRAEKDKNEKKHKKRKKS